MINFEKKLKAELQKKDKDTIIDLYLQKCYEFELEKTQFQQQLDNAKNALDKQLEEKNKRIRKLNIEAQKYYEDAYCNNFAIEQLEKVNELLTNTIIEVTQEEFDLNKLCYLEEISAKFCDKINQQIQELRGQ